MTRGKGEEEERDKGTSWLGGGGGGGGGEDSVNHHVVTCNRFSLSMLLHPIGYCFHGDSFRQQ